MYVVDEPTQIWRLPILQEVIYLGDRWEHAIWRCDELTPKLIGAGSIHPAQQGEGLLELAWLLLES